MSFIIKRQDSGEYYQGEGIPHGPWTPTVEDAMQFQTLDAALRVKDTLPGEIGPRVIDLDMPATSVN